MESFNLALSVVGPLFIYMTVGGLIRNMGWFSKENFKALNSLTFQVLIPLSLFFNIYQADLNSAVRIDVFVFSVAGVLAECILFSILLTRMISDNKDRVTMVQGIFRSNFVLFGGSIAASLCDDNGVALVAALSAVIVPMYNILAVILFENMNGDKIKLKKTLISILKNPLVEAGFLGAIFNILNISLPKILTSPLIQLGKSATPLALVSLGGILSFGSMIKHIKYLVFANISRLIFVPVVMVLLGIIVGYRNNDLIAVMAIFACPTAVSSAPMAQAMGGNGDLAGEIVATTSVLSIFSLFLFVVILSRAGLIG